MAAPNPFGVLFVAKMSESRRLGVMDENNIDCYDVPGTSFGLTKPSLWIRHDEDYPRAKQLFHEHEKAYAEHARERYQQETGYNPNAEGKD